MCFMVCVKGLMPCYEAVIEVFVVQSGLKQARCRYLDHLNL
jgi:hypothetical protein